MLEGWFTHSVKNVFGQMISSDARALQNLLKLQIFDLPRSTMKLRVGHKFSTFIACARLSDSIVRTY